MLDLALAELRHFHFLRPWWLLALLPGLLAIRFLWTAQDPAAQWRGTIAPHILKAIRVRGGTSAWLNPVRLSLVALPVMVIAVAGPSWERRPSPFIEDQAALVIALDVSSTMDQQDVQPSRLERAKQKIHDLLDLRGGARTGLIVYAGTAHSVIPLSNDPDITLNLLDAIDTAMMPRPGKVPERTLDVADAMFAETPAPGTLLLIGDGVGPNSRDVFADYFTNQNHQLLILGVGLEEPEVDGALPLERAALTDLARASGGFYQDLTLDRTDVARLNRRADSFFATADDDTRPWVDAGYYLLFPAALLFLAWFRKGWTLHWAIAGLILISTGQPVQAAGFRFMDLWLTPDQQGRYYLERGDYGAAAERFEDTAWKAVAYYLNEDFATAAELFLRIETADGTFNLGNAYAHGRQYLLARDAYDRVLRLEPNQAGAARNRAIVQALIDEINRVSESQQAERGERSDELGADDPRTAEGAEREDMGPIEVEQVTAEQLLSDEALHEIWMRQVQSDPADFLAAKFFMQLERAEAGGGPDQ